MYDLAGASRRLSHISRPSCQQLINLPSHRPGNILHAGSRLHKGARNHVQKDLPEDYSKWISEMISLCFDLSTRSSTTIIEWDGFEEGCYNFFTKGSHYSLNASIRQTFNHIRALEHRLGALIKELEQDQSTVSPLRDLSHFHFRYAV